MANNPSSHCGSRQYVRSDAGRDSSRRCVTFCSPMPTLLQHEHTIDTTTPAMKPPAEPSVAMTEGSAGGCKGAAAVTKMPRGAALNRALSD